VQIGEEIAEIHLFMYSISKMAVVRHLGFVLSQFWTTNVLLHWISLWDCTSVGLK